MGSICFTRNKHSQFRRVVHRTDWRNRSLRRSQSDQHDVGEPLQRHGVGWLEESGWNHYIGAELPTEQALSGPASFLIAPGETYDFLFRPEQEGDMQLTLDLSLLKEKVTQTVRVGAVEGRQ